MVDIHSMFQLLFHMYRLRQSTSECMRSERKREKEREGVRDRDRGETETERVQEKR